MKYCLWIMTLFFTNIIQSQKVFEYSLDKEISFMVYSETGNRLKKISKPEDFKTDNPEAVVMSYFFATSNSALSNLFMDKENFIPKDSSHFDRIEKSAVEDIYVQLLHKTSYTFQGDERCYVMFIVHIKDVPFLFPTLLSLVKKGDRWFIDKIDNQQKLTDSLIMFKPCVLSNIVEGESENIDISTIINKIRANSGGIDFNKLFDELVAIQNNETLLEKLTMSDNLDCSWVAYKETVKGKSEITGILPNTSIKIFREQDEGLISQIEKNNDSIVLTSKLDFEYSKRKYAVLKYNRIRPNGTVIKEKLRLDENLDPEKPAREMISLYENLKVEIFSDLTPSMNRSPLMESSLYQMTRGVYGVLNISKLNDLFENRREMFTEYIE